MKLEWAFEAQPRQMHTFAQTQPPSRPQQVAGTAAVGADIVMLIELWGVVWVIKDLVVKTMLCRAGVCFCFE